MSSAALLAGLGVSAAFMARADLPPIETSICCALLTLVLGLLLIPPQPEKTARTFPEHILWPVIMAATTLLVSWLMMPDGHGLRPTIMLAGGILILSLLLVNVTLVIGQEVGSLPISVFLVLLVLFSLSSAPVWLAPAAVYADPAGNWTDLLIWSSPVSYLSELAGYDYLRHQWIYASSPLGSMRYSYPDALATSVIYLLLTSLVYLLSPVPTKNHKRIPERR